MSKVAIVTDSTAYIPDDLVKKYNITVAPQILIWGEETFQDGVNIQPTEFYQRLSNSKVMPTTSQVSIVDMKTIFEKLVAKGYDVLGIFISSKLSGTIDSAVKAKEMLPGIADKIAVVDSFSTSMGLGFHVLAAARAAEENASLSECQKLAEKSQEHTGVFFVVETLEFLRRGGRIGGAQALLGTALNIKPVLELRDGRIEPIEKVRTKSKALDRVIDLVVEQVGNRTPVRLAALHANAESEAKSALETIKKRLNPIEELLANVSPVVGTHAGPGTVGIAYMAGM